ncbi:MAG: hypothetical protein IIW74_03715, partial [Rikenellaceae bacterium]|nr:hypothetical protein [Rikenellaceae bacterium]
MHITNILCAFFIAQRRNLFFYEIFPLLTPFLAHLTHFNFSLDKGARLEIHNSQFTIHNLELGIYNKAALSGAALLFACDKIHSVAWGGAIFNRGRHRV